MMNELIKPDPYFGGVVDSLPKLTKNTDKANLEWVVTMREGLRQMRDSGGCIRMIRYEELIDSPKQVLSDIANFAGLRPDDKFLRYGESILQPGSTQASFEMHPAIKPLFDETRAALGYQ